MMTGEDSKNHTNNDTSTKMSTVITICVTAAVGSKRSVVKCDATTTTIDQFQVLALTALGIPPLSHDTTTELFVDCFPQPRRPIAQQPENHSSVSVIAAASGSDDGQINARQPTLFDCGIRHQDRIIVVTSESTSKPKGRRNNNKNNSPAAQSPPHQPQQEQRSRRKAAIAATESFAATIQQQDEQMMAITSKTSPAKRTKASPKKSSNTISSGKSASRHFTNLERIASDTNEVVGGRRLRDGAVTTSPRRKRTKMGTSSTTTNRGSDIVEGLVSTTTDTSSSARLMRKGWRQAVESAYEQNQAHARVAASQNLIRMVEFTITNESIGTSTSDQPAQLQVAYKKGVQGRGVYTDVVDFIDYDVLVATISEIHPAEALRSFHLALLSPRVFWSLLYHYKNHITTTGLPVQNIGDVVQASLRWCCPNLDWTYLRRRPEQLSEKAKENLRQKHERSNPASNNMDWEAAAAAILSVEQAMDGMVVVTNGEEEAANPNTVVGGDDENNNDWALFNVTSFEMSDLIECITSYEADSTDDTVEHEAVAVLYPLNHVVYALTQKLNIRTIYELANLSNGAREVNDSLTKVLPEVDKIIVPRVIPEDENNDIVQISLAAIEQWIESAQETTAHLSVISICDNNAEIVEVLTKTLRCSTPRDLLFWESVPSLCVEQVQNRWRDVAVSEDMSHDQMNEWERIVEEYITESNILKWCRRAHVALEQVAWLNNYVAPIEFD